MRNKKFVSRFTQRYERGRSLKRKKTIEYGEKKMFNMAEGIVTFCNVARLRHGIRPVAAPAMCLRYHDSEFTRWQHPAVWLRNHAIECAR